MFINLYPDQEETKYSDQTRNFFNILQTTSIHFLARCCNICKPLKKIRNFSSYQASSEENGEISIGFPVQRKAVVRRGHIRRIEWVIKALDTQVGQYFVGCKGPLSRAILLKEHDDLCEISAAFLLQNVPQLHQQK